MQRFPAVLTITWYAMNITGELGYMRNDSDLYTYATGAFSLANGSGNGGYGKQFNQFP
ncbi:hypothetical protein [Providencia huaxiensis]|uniref:hypothetical protein n=1 Tax=Providencia huaxiensis TaxID=2027290 RepID=UPI0034DD0BA1